MSRVHSPLAVEQAQRRLREVLVELRAAAEQDHQTGAYYRLWLIKLIEVMSAESGECYVVKGDGSWDAVAIVNGNPAEDEAAKQRIGEVLTELRRTGQPVVKSGPGLTTIAFPFIVGEVRPGPDDDRLSVHRRG
jgi:hypothetical protein